MEKPERNRLINALEASKSLITSAQNHLEDGNEADAQEALNSAFLNIKENLYKLNSNFKGGTSTERMDG